MRDWRKAQGLTQLVLARRLRVVQSIVCDWEGGNKLPGVGNAFAIERLSAGKVPAAAWTKPSRSGTQRRAEPVSASDAENTTSLTR